ncbi:extracellular solute-binding protein [Alphaproteobacteria bacterium]|nr:extracellular solute-binding protein [Alphaproteobacteria bacterium]
MKKLSFIYVIAMAVSAPAFADGSLNIYNWSDYIGEDTIANFEAETGIDVTYDMYDSNEVLDAKMMAGSSGYDLVVPTADFLVRGREAGVYQDLDLSRLENAGNQDPQIQSLANQTLNSESAGLVYLWGTTGIAYNEKMIADRLGEDAPTDSWSLILDPKYASKLEDCGIAVLDAPTDVLPNVIAYLGKDGTSENKADFEAAGKILNAIQPHLRYIHSSQSINDMANGDLCAAIMWSGDAFQAAARAEEAENGHVINYVIPSEGTNMWFDMLAIPKDAKNLDNAYKFIDYMMRADVAAANVNYVWYASGNAAANADIDPEILEHPGIYPTAAAQKNLFVIPVYDAKLDRAVNRVWSRFASGG